MRPGLLIGTMVIVAGLAGCGQGSSDTAPLKETGTYKVEISGATRSTCSFKLTPDPGHGQERQTKAVTAIDFCHSAPTAQRYELEVAPDGQSGRLRLIKSGQNPPPPVEHKVDFE